jgi:carbonic anhydrase
MLLKNVAWSNEVATHDKEFFTRLSEGQNPDVLWIGCSDSRVPAESITDSRPGELFVHRNIANLISVDDQNAMSVIEYAVKVLKVLHIVVCGHYQCGGVRAALMPESAQIPLVNQRIAGLRRLAHQHQDDIGALPDLNQQVDRLAELNVLRQIETLEAMPIIQQAEQDLSLHGWIFGLHDGLLTVLSSTEHTHMPVPVQPYTYVASL